MATVLVLSSCKEEFAINKGVQNSSINAVENTSAKLCSQSTLISPKVDILMLWDNSSSFNFVTSATKSSMSNLITSVSENFDYHILSLPLVPASTSELYEGILVAKNAGSVTGNATAILKTKDQAVASLSFTTGFGANERGVDRAVDVIKNNRTNGIFRQDAYTIIVLMSNEDDKGCETDNKVSYCPSTLRTAYTLAKKNKLLCLRGNSTVDCSTTGVTSSLNSTMMRFINISPLTQCKSGFDNMNAIYRDVAKTIYETPYTNGWPKSNDQLSPDVAGAPDSYNLCSIDFNHIFDGVNTAIKQTLLRHKYEYWPVAAPGASIDPDTIRVVRSDGKILANRAVNNNITNGYELLLDSNGNALTSTQSTRYYPTLGEPFTGKMIRLFGVEGNDKVVYPDCLTVTYSAVKENYGYIYLKYGEPNVSTIEVQINNKIVPKSSSEGWDYMGLQYMSALDPNLKVVDLPPGTTSAYVIRLNGSYKFKNTGTATNVNVYYNSKSAQ